MYGNLWWKISGFINERIVKGTWVQYLATKKGKTDMLKTLLELGYILYFLIFSLFPFSHQFWPKRSDGGEHMHSIGDCCHDWKRNSLRSALCPLRGRVEPKVGSDGSLGSCREGSEWGVQNSFCFHPIGRGNQETTVSKCHLMFTTQNQSWLKLTVAGEEQDCAGCQFAADLCREGENSLCGILGGGRVNVLGFSFSVFILSPF